MTMKEVIYFTLGTYSFLHSKIFSRSLCMEKLFLKFHHDIMSSELNCLYMKELNVSTILVLISEYIFLVKKKNIIICSPATFLIWCLVVLSKHYPQAHSESYFSDMMWFYDLIETFSALSIQTQINGNGWELECLTSKCVFRVTS